MTHISDGDVGEFGLPAGSCPADRVLRRFDQGSLTAAEIERLSDHVATCSTCRMAIYGQAERDSRLLAELLAAGWTHAKEPQFQQLQVALLDLPEPISTADLEAAESTAWGGTLARRPI